MSATPTGSLPPSALQLLLDEQDERVRVLDESVRWQEQRFAAVMEIGRALGRTFELDELLGIIIAKITELMDAERATLFLADRERGELWSKVLKGDSESGSGRLAEIRIPIETGIAGWVVQAGRIANIPSAYDDARFNPAVDRDTGYYTRSILCAPLFDHRQNVIGAVQVLNKRRGVFDGDDERLLEAMAAQAAVSIENTRLYRDLVSRNRDLTEAQSQLRHKMAELDLLYEVERQISGAVGLEGILQGILDKACQVVGAEAGSVLLQDDGNGEMYFKAVQGPRRDDLRRLRIPAGRGIAGQVARAGVPRVVNDPKADPDHDPGVDSQLGFVTRNLVAAPLRVRGQYIGALELLNKRAGPFLDEDLKIVTLITGQASRAISIGQAREAGERAERLSLLGQMVSGILHDLKTPMTVISGHAQLMAMEDDGAERERHVDSILKQFDHIAAMTREIMAFAKGQREILVRKVYLHRFLDEVREILRHDMEHYGVVLVLDDRYRGAARFDENKLKRVITNIARNACQAMHEAGGEKTFTWTVDHEGDAWLLFEFTDTGPGIPSELDGRIFESFASHGKADGTGLGLAIVKKIVEEHGGTVTYESAAGVGTTFRIKLPL